MTEENKFYLPYVLDGIMTKLSALFLKKLVLFDFEKLEAKHLRHYDHECQGIISLTDFLERKINKNSIYAFQMIKDPNFSLSEDVQLIQEEELKNKTQKTIIKNLDQTATPINKFLSRVNTTIQESDNSFIFSPNVNKHRKITSRSSYPDSICEKSEILRKLLNRVKRMNIERSQQCITPTRHSSFNMTLGKQSFHTFQNKCNCQCHNQRCNKESKMTKRRRILQRFEQIEQKIQDQAPPVYFANYITPRPVNAIRQYRGSKASYSVYEPSIYEPRPRERDIIYIKQREKADSFYDVRSNEGMSTSRSVTHIGYAHQVYI